MSKKRKKPISKFIVMFLVLFAIGWVSNDMFDFFTNLDKEQPFAVNSNEIKSPGNWVEESDIKMRDKAVIIMVKNATWATFTDTNSMDPVIDSSSHALKVMPKYPLDLNIGDIISYKNYQGVVIHRIVDMGIDSEGTYYITKGDNNKHADSDKVRFNQVTGVVVGILY